MGLNTAPTLIQTQQAAITLQNAATGTGNGTAMTLVPGSQSVTLTVSGGVGTIIVEVSFDGGSTYLTQFYQLGLTGAVAASITAAASAAVYVVPVPPGANRLRARISAFVSDAITVTAIERRMA